MKTKSAPVVSAVILVIFASGCTFPSSRRTVPAAQANVLQRSELGVVTSVRDVNIEGSKGQIGLYGGDVVGGALASGGKGVTGRVTQAAGASTATGSFTLKRLDFNVGGGDWGDPSIVANEVQVKFKLALKGVPAL